MSQNTQNTRYCFFVRGSQPHGVECQEFVQSKVTWKKIVGSWEEGVRAAVDVSLIGSTIYREFNFGGAGSRRSVRRCCMQQQTVQFSNVPWKCLTARDATDTICFICVYSDRSYADSSLLPEHVWGRRVRVLHTAETCEGVVSQHGNHTWLWPCHYSHTSQSACFHKGVCLAWPILKFWNIFCLKFVKHHTQSYRGAKGGVNQAA